MNRKKLIKQALKKTNKNPVICLTTYFDKRFEEIGKICLKGLRKYAKKHDLHLKLHNEITSSRPPAWNKILVVQKLLNDPENYDFVLWIDPDTLFIRFNEDIRNEIEPNKNFYLVKCFVYGKETPLTGVFLIRNCEWSKDFLRRVWNKKKYIYHNWWENAAVNDLIGYKGIIEYNPKKLFLVKILYRLRIKHSVTKIAKRFGIRNFAYKLFKKIEPNNQHANEKKFVPKKTKDLEKVKWLDLKWDSLTNLNEAKNPIINHYPAMSPDERIKRMVADLKKVKKL